MRASQRKMELQKASLEHGYGASINIAQQSPRHTPRDASSLQPLTSRGHLMQSLPEMDSQKLQVLEYEDAEEAAQEIKD